MNWRLAAKIVITIALLAFIFSSISISEAIEHVANINAIWLLPVFIMMVFSRVIAALRWHILLQHYQREIPLRDVIKITFISTSLGYLLPGAVGNDLVRGYQLTQKYGQVGNTAATILIDRFIGIYSMFLVALIGAFIARYMSAPFDFTYALLALNLLVIIAWILSSVLSTKMQAIKISRNSNIQSAYEKLMSLAASVSDMSTMRAIGGKIFLLSLLLQLARCLIYFWLYLAFAQVIPFAYFVIFVPLVFVLVFVPVSIGGLGVREGSLAYLFGLIGIAPEISVSVGLLSQVLLILAVLPGFAWWLIDRGKQEDLVENH